MDYDKLFKRALAYGTKKGLGSDAEDFAQECLIRAFEVGPINLEYVFLNYREFHRADKRILSGPEGQLSSFRTVSLDTPVDSENADSAKLSDYIGEPGPDVEGRGELDLVDRMLELIFSRARNKRARAWARDTFMIYLVNHVL